MEVHLIGEVVGAQGFGRNSLFCKWGIVHGPCWELIEGVIDGQTHVDRPLKGDCVVWTHPLDVHYLMKGLAGWPKIHLQVWSVAANGQIDLCGYGFCFMPSSEQTIDIDCETWIPEGTFSDRVRKLFFGRGIELRHDRVIYTARDRYRLCTLSTGRVKLRLGLYIQDRQKTHLKI